MEGSEPAAGFSGDGVADRMPRLLCMSTDREAAAVLQHVVQTIVPGAWVETVDTTILRDPPDADCVILSVGAMHGEAEVLARGLRARGYRNALLLVADSPESMARDKLAFLGIAGVLPTREIAMTLPAALAQQIELQDAAVRSPAAARLLESLRHLQALVAAGQAAGGLRHKLNNPLAALLAEAQMMELEALSPEHANATKRIVELCRRVISVADAIDSHGTQRAG